MFIQTYKGNKFSFDKPVFDIEEIAHSLSMLCRYGGHSKYFYSVGEHSYWCAYYMLEWSPAYALDALLHDGTEGCGLVDIPRPVKTLLPDYYIIEDDLYAKLANHFGLSYPIPEIVKQMDNAVLMAESELVLEGGRCEGWSDTEQAKIEDFNPQYWSPEIAKIKFLEMFDELTQT